MSNNVQTIVGFAFVYFEDDRDAADAIRGLDNAPFGYDRRRLSVEWARVCYCASYLIKRVESFRIYLLICGYLFFFSG